MVKDTLLMDADKIQALSDSHMKDYIISSINTSLDNPLSINTEVNFLDVYDQTIKNMQEEYADDPEMLNAIKEEKHSVYYKIKQHLEDKLGLEMDFEAILVQEQFDIINLIYSYFITEYHDNIVDFLANYIVKNKKGLCENILGTENKKKDVTDPVAKKVFKNSKDAVIMSNVFPIITTVLAGDIEPIDFLNYLVKDPAPMNRAISDLILKNIAQPISFNSTFYNTYTSYVRNNNVSMIDVLTSLQRKLTSVFPKNEEFGIYN